MNERCDKCGIDLTDIAVNRPKIATFYAKNENGERDHIGYHKLKLCDRCYRHFQKPYRDIKNNYTRSVINWLENEEIPTQDEDGE